MDKNLIAKFNQLNDLLKKEDFNSSVLCGDAVLLLKDKLTKLCPHQKILLLTSNLSNNKDVIDKIKEQDINVTALEKQPESLSVDNALDMFNTPEDIRLVLCVDYALLDFALYYSKVKKVPLLYLANNISLKNAFKTHLRIQNGKNYDVIELSYDRHVLIDESLLSNSSFMHYAVYEDVVSNAFTLIDYRIVRYIRKKSTYQNSYLLAKSTIQNTYGILKKPLKERNVYLALASLSIGIANFISRGKFLSGLTFNVLENYGVDLTGLKLEFCIRLIKLSLAVFKDGVTTKTMPDYEMRIKRSCKEFNEDFGKTLTAFLKAKKAYLSAEKAISEFIKINEQELLKLCKSLNVAISISNTLSKEKQKNNKDINNVIDFGADFKEGFNLLTFLREKGVLEFIKND